MRELDRGESFVVTRNGVPVGELMPLRQRRFVAAEAAVAMFRGAPPVSYERFRADLDTVASQDPSSRCLMMPATLAAFSTRRSSSISMRSILRVLPLELAITAITMAELAAGPHTTSDLEERGRRQDRLQRAAANFASLPFDDDSARAYGRIYAAVAAAGRKGAGHTRRRPHDRFNRGSGRSADVHAQSRRLQGGRRSRRGGPDLIVAGAA